MKIVERLYNIFVPWYNENEQKVRDAGCAAHTISAHAAIAKAESVVNGYRAHVVHGNNKK